jgi:hypothetical protein
MRPRAGGSRPRVTTQVLKVPFVCDDGVYVARAKADYASAGAQCMQSPGDSRLAGCAAGFPARPSELGRRRRDADPDGCSRRAAAHPAHRKCSAGRRRTVGIKKALDLSSQINWWCLIGRANLWNPSGKCTYTKATSPGCCAATSSNAMWNCLQNGHSKSTNSTISVSAERRRFLSMGGEFTLVTSVRELPDGRADLLEAPASRRMTHDSQRLEGGFIAAANATAPHGKDKLAVVHQPRELRCAVWRIDRYVADEASFCCEHREASGMPCHHQQRVYRVLPNVAKKSEFTRPLTSPAELANESPTLIIHSHCSGSAIGDGNISIVE